MEQRRGKACVHRKWNDNTAILSGDNMLVPIKEMYIDDLCVDEAARGKGVATELYKHAVAYARETGCHNVTLNVWEGNSVALAFYEKMGMKPQKTKLETILDNA